MHSYRTSPSLRGESTINGPFSIALLKYQMENTTSIPMFVAQMLCTYGILTYIWVIFGLNVTKYSIHGASGLVISVFFVAHLLAIKVVQPCRYAHSCLGNLPKTIYSQSPPALCCLLFGPPQLSFLSCALGPTPLLPWLRGLKGTFCGALAFRQTHRKP